MKQYVIRKEIKRQIKNSIPKEELHILTFFSPETDVEWVREGKEFIFGKRMFDVVQKEIKGDSTIFHCINDKEEAILFANLDNYVQKEIQGDSKQSKSKRMNGKLVRLLLFCDSLTIPIEFFREIHIASSSAYFFSIKSNFLKVSPQPPKA